MFTCSLNCYIVSLYIHDNLSRRICKAISVWLDQYPQDFDEPPSYITLNKIVSFTSMYLDLLSCIKEVHQRCNAKLNTFTSSPHENGRLFILKYK